MAPLVSMNNRNRKISSSSMVYDDMVFCSQESILLAIEKFIQSVSNMNSVVMVPSKLHDLEEEVDDAKPVADGMSSTSLNLYNAFKMLSDAKENIIWGGHTTDGEEDIDSSSTVLVTEFREHIHKLQGILNQFTNLADNLSTKYQRQTGIREE